MQNDTMATDSMEAQDLRMQVVQDQTEVDNLHAQNLELVEKHSAELNELQIRLTEANQFKINAEAEIEKLRMDIDSVRHQFTIETDSLKAKICEVLEYHKHRCHRTRIYFLLKYFL